MAKKQRRDSTQSTTQETPKIHVTSQKRKPTEKQKQQKIKKTTKQQKMIFVWKDAKILLIRFS